MQSSSLSCRGNDVNESEHTFSSEDEIPEDIEMFKVRYGIVSGLAACVVVFAADVWCMSGLNHLNIFPENCFMELCPLLRVWDFLLCTSTMHELCNLLVIQLCVGLSFFGRCHKHISV